MEAANELKKTFLDRIGEHKAYYYKYYEHKSWWFYYDNFPLQVIKHDLVSGKLSKHLKEVIEDCKEIIQGFVDEIDDEGYHHFIAPMKCYMAEYWQKTNSTQISFSENVVKELNLKKSTYIYKNRYWRYSYSLVDLDVRTQLYTDITRWEKNEKPVDDKAYKTIVKYLKPIDYIEYSLNFEEPGICKVSLNYEDPNYGVEPVVATVHYDTIIKDLNTSLGLLLMGEVTCIQKEILHINEELNTIMEMITKL